MKYNEKNEKDIKQPEFPQTNTDQLRKKFGLFIKKHRNAKGYTQQQLADILEITPKSVNFFERGTTFPSQENIFKLALALDMSIDEFIFNYSRFDSTICLPEINEMLTDLSNEEQGMIISMLKAACESMKARKTN